MNFDEDILYLKVVCNQAGRESTLDVQVKRKRIKGVLFRKE
jgi:hypothetical protein